MVDLRPLKYALVFAVCAVILHSAWTERDLHGAWPEVITTLQAVALIVIALLAFWADRGDARHFPMRLPYLTSILAAVSLLAFGGIKAVAALKDATPAVVKAGQFEDFNGTSLDLKTDGRYRFCDVVFGERCCWGTYVLRGDTVVLSSTDDCKQGTLVFGHCAADGTKTCLRWVKPANGEAELRVHEDHRTH